eukprot:7016800-Pyramimonas_sp.AAC.1
MMTVAMMSLARMKAMVLVNTMGKCAQTLRLNVYWEPCGFQTCFNTSIVNSFKIKRLRYEFDMRTRGRARVARIVPFGRMGGRAMIVE